MFDDNLGNNTRLARQYDAVSKPLAGFWVFVTKGESKAASGRTLPEVDIHRRDITQHRMTQSERGKYASVNTFFYDHDKASRITVTVGEGAPVFNVRHVYPNITEAQRAAASKLNALQRGAATLSLTLIGNLSLQAEGKIKVNGVRTPVDNTWLISRVEHQYSNTGFVSRIEAETLNR